MKVLVVVVILIHVSQHALAVVVQEYEGMESVLLPYQYFGMLPEVPSVVWRRSDLNQTVIHLLKYDNDKLKEEYRHSERTYMKTNALESGDFSLTVKKPQLSDSSNYTCSLLWETKRGGPKEWILTQIELQVKDDEEEVVVQQGAESIQLPCKASADLPEDTTVDWTHFDPELIVVHVSRNKTDDLQTQDRFYRGRTQMNKDMSLTLKDPTDRDGGVYICTVYREGDVLRSKVLLQVVQDLPQPKISLSDGVFGVYQLGFWVLVGSDFTITCSIQPQYPGGSFQLISDTKKPLNLTLPAVNHSAHFLLSAMGYAHQGSHTCVYHVDVFNHSFSSSQSPALYLTVGDLVRNLIIRVVLVHFILITGTIFLYFYCRASRGRFRLKRRNTG